MPVFKFSSEIDAEYIRRRDAEAMRLYCKPRRWLINNQSIQLNIYGEPGTSISGTDGATSTPSLREFTSLSSNFVSSGVMVGDILEIFTESIKDAENRRYQIDSVQNSTKIVVNRNWPIGSQSNLKFSVILLNERYSEFKQLVPFYCKLQPPVEELNKYGIQEKRDALVIISIEVCDKIGLSPKIGDRFVYQYEDRNIHYEMKDMMMQDQLGDSGVVLHYIGGANRTDIRLP